MLLAILKTHVHVNVLLKCIGLPPSFDDGSVGGSYGTYPVCLDYCIFYIYKALYMIRKPINVSSDIYIYIYIYIYIKHYMELIEVI